MKPSRSLWICCVLYLCNSVNNVHTRSTKVLDIAKVNSEVSEQNNNLKPYKSDDFKNIRSLKLNDTLDNNINKRTHSEFSSKASKAKVSFLNISNSGAEDTINNSTKQLVSETATSLISFFQNILTSFTKSEKYDNNDFIEDIQKNLMKIYEKKFEDKNEIVQFEDNNLREETRNKAFIPIMYILGVITTMIKVLVLLTFKGVTIGAILLLATYTYKLKKKHGLDHHPHHHHPHHHHPHVHYRAHPYYKQVNEPHPLYSHGDVHLSDLQDYYEEPSVHPAKDILLSQLIHQSQAYSRPVELQVGTPTYSSDGEKNTIPLESLIDPSQQESNTYSSVVENLLKNYANETRGTSPVPSQTGPSTEDPSEVLEQAGLLDPAQSLYDLELMSPSLESYEYPQKQYYRVPPGYSRYPYKSIRNPSKRKRIRKQSSHYRSPYSGYGK